jgi:cation transport regulator ChaB
MSSVQLGELVEMLRLTGRDDDDKNQNDDAGDETHAHLHVLFRAVRNKYKPVYV